VLKSDFALKLRANCTQLSNQLNIRDIFRTLLLAFTWRFWRLFGIWEQNNKRDIKGEVKTQKRKIEWCVNQAEPRVINQLAIVWHLECKPTKRANE
jgi:hypothetical protein